MSESTPEPKAGHQPPEDAGRRGFLAKLAAIGVGGAIVAVPFGAGVWSFLDPVLRKGEGGADDLIPVAKLSDLPDDEAVRRFEVVGPQVDAWIKQVGPLGSVYIRRKKPQSDELLVLHATCPHAGCFVNYTGSQFLCPCHNSTFHPDGTQVEGQCVSPRPMDSLQYEVRDGEILVKFENFRSGIPQKIQL